MKNELNMTQKNKGIKNTPYSTKKKKKKFLERKTLVSKYISYFFRRVPVANTQDCDIVIKEYKLQSCIMFTFGLIPLRKYPSPLGQ